MSYLTSFFSHAKAVQAAATDLGIEVLTEMKEFSLRLDFGDRRETWKPKFMASIGGRMAYTDRLVKGTVGFAGWSPNAPWQCEIARDKSAFKRFAIANGIPTPAACFDPALIGGPFLVKQAASSFGEGIRGPYLAYQSGNDEHQLNEGEFYENFIFGLIGKVWCWGCEVVSVELQKPSMVTGDGTSTLEQLVRALPNSRIDVHDWAVVACVARYTGPYGLTDSVPDGVQVGVEYRYGSRYALESYADVDRWQEIRSSPTGEHLCRIAGLLARECPAGPDTPRLFTFDCVVGLEGEPWALEMNCNPLVAPGAYAAMLREARRGADGWTPNA
jgi:hypothetical protein